MKSTQKFFFICLTTLAFHYNYAFAQKLHVGDTCPDVQLNHIINYSTTTASLSDFKNKLIILDFWGTGCSGCIKSFSHLDSLQKKFGDRIQIIMVNQETEDSTKNFFSLHKKIKIPSLPFVTQDSILAIYFPHVFVPHQVWLNDKKNILAITGGYNTTEKHVAGFLQNNEIKLELKADINPTVSNMPVVFYSDSSQIANISYYSYIMPSLNAFNLNYQREATEGSDKTTRIIMNKASILRLLQVAFGEEGKYDFKPGNTVILSVENASKYDYPIDDNLYDEWNKFYSFLYELKVPVIKADSLYKFMQQDLQRFFNIKVKVEKRKIECYVLVRTSDRIKLSNNKDDFKVQNIDTDSGTITQFQNVPFSQFAWTLKNNFSNELKEPFVDGTQLDGALKISYNNKDLFDEADQKINIQGYRQLLHKYDLDLVKKECVTNALVIQEKSSHEK